MTTTRIPLQHPSLSELRSLDETTTDTNPLDNGQPAVASAVRVLEQSAVYVATRMQMGYGGTCRFIDFGVGSDFIKHYFGTEPFTANALCFFGITASATFSGGVGVTSSPIDPTTTLVDVDISEDYTDGNQIQHNTVAVPVGSGDSGDLATGVFAQLSVAVAAGTLRVWYFTVHPVGLTAGSEVTI